MAAQLASAATGVLPLVSGPVLRGAVVGSFGQAVVIVVATATGPRVVSLLTGRAAGVPTGVRLAGANPLPQVAAGTSALVGDGRVLLDGLDIRVVRWWESRVPVTRPVPARVAALSSASACAQRGVPDPAVDRLRAALVADGSCADRYPHSTLGASIDGLIGLGRGLTPGGDDVIAGLLSALHAGGRRDIVDRIRSRLRGLDDRTTTLSADLLRLAADGHACLEALGVLRSMGSPDTGPTGRTIGRLLSIGHTSGADLATGLVVGFEFARTQPAAAGCAQAGIDDRQVVR